MRAFLVLTTALLFSLGSAPVSAQTFGIGAHGGVSVPTGDYSDGTELGFLGGIDLWYPLTMVTPALSWYTSADAVAHSVDADDMDSGFLYVPVMTGLRFDVPLGPAAAFATGQLGLVLAKGPSFEAGTNGTTVDVDSNWTTNFGFNVGGGLQLTDNIYAGVKYYPLSGIDFEYESFEDVAGFDDYDVSFLDIYIGFGVR
jgi:opacity protein-like surface antigen